MKAMGDPAFAHISQATVAMMMLEFAREPHRYSAFAAYDVYSEPRGLVVFRRSRDSETHGVLEVAWFEARHYSQDERAAVLADIRREMMAWAGENGLETITTFTTREGRALEQIYKALGFKHMGQIYGMAVNDDGGA